MFKSLLPYKRISVEGNIVDSWSNDKGSNPLSACYIEIINNPSDGMEDITSLRFVG